MTTLKERFWSKVNADGPIPPACPERGPFENLPLSFARSLPRRCAMPTIERIARRNSPRESPRAILAQWAVIVAAMLYLAAHVVAALVARGTL